jgi:tripartite-type tricarboxylate transporter receptor subunit TctC
MNETGVPNVSMDIWWGIVAKSGTSAEETGALNKALREAIDSDELKSRFASLGIYLQSSTPAELGAIFSAEIPRLSKVVRDSGASVD